jgi:cytochrome c-type protein NapC
MEARGLRALAGAIAACAIVSGDAGALDWEKVPSKEVTIFHPGQGSYEWMLTESDHSAAPKIRQGKRCAECHTGEEAKIGATIASGKKLEPEPAKVGQPSSPVQVQFAHDGERLHARLRWPAQGAGSAKSSIALLLDDGQVNAARLTGCWATCHSDLPGMPHALPAPELTKYLAQSRVKMGRTGGGADSQPEATLRELLGKGLFLEWWEAELGSASAKAEDGWVLDSRHESKPPLVSATGRLEGGFWTAELSRKLVVGTPGRKDFAPGKLYTFGIAVHDGDAEGRFHRVSLEHTLALDAGEADFVARRP